MFSALPFSLIRMYGGTLFDAKISYTEAELIIDNLVFLPAAGARDGSYVDLVGDFGIYWSSSAYVEDYAYLVSFDSLDVYPDFNDDRILGCSVRLITESN